MARLNDTNRVLDDFKHLIRVLQAFAQILALAAIYFLIWKAFYRNNDFPPYYGRGKWVLIGLYVMLTTVVFQMGDGFKFGHLKLIDVAVSQVISILLVDILTYFELCLIANVMVTPLPMLLVFAVSSPVACIACYIYSKAYHSMYVPHDMLMIYGNPHALQLKKKMEDRSDHYKITQVISVDEDMDTLINAIQRHDAVIINDIAGIRRNDILKHCYEHGIRTYLVPKISDIIIQGAQEITLFDTPLKLVKGRGLSLPQRFMKRSLDLVVCLIALIPALPVMLLVALAIKLQDGGPVLYKQKRVTRGGKTFNILKFRSMVVDAEAGGYDLSMRANERDSRITPVGRVIRAARIDELPQLFNIIKGDMSLVGPRPERVENVEAYARMLPEWHLREKVRGGLTGYAQIYGRYNTLPIDKTKLDVMYIENYSLFLDIKLIIMTIRIIFTPESTEGFCPQAEQVTEEEAASSSASVQCASHEKKED